MGSESDDKDLDNIDDSEGNDNIQCINTSDRDNVSPL